MSRFVVSKLRSDQSVYSGTCEPVNLGSNMRIGGRSHVRPLPD